MEGRGLPGSSETPACAQPLPALSRRGWLLRWQGVAGWHNLTADPVDDRLSPPSVQSFLLLSPLLNVRSTRRAAEHEIETAWAVLPSLAALGLKPLLPQPASCIYAVKPPLHMLQHETNTRCRCCESEQSRCSTPVQGLIMASAN